MKAFIVRGLIALLVALIMVVLVFVVIQYFVLHPPPEATPSAELLTDE